MPVFPSPLLPPPGAGKYIAHYKNVERNKTDAINFLLTGWTIPKYGSRMATELSTTQAAARLGVSPITVRLWCRRRLFRNAYELETPRGPVWMIPESDLEGFAPPKMGRPKKTRPSAVHAPEEKAA